MLAALKNARSLTFCQAAVYTGNIISPMAANISLATAVTTTQFNNQLNNFMNVLSSERHSISQKVAQGMVSNPAYEGARGDGVKLAWKYEQADVALGGKGAGNFNAGQRQEILENGKLRNYEGHHINSVKNAPEHQGNPDNVIMLEEHRDGSGPRNHFDAHDRIWKNQTSGDMLDRDGMLEKTNSKRVFRNELSGLGIAISIGAGIGFALSFIVSLAKSGVSIENVETAIIGGMKASLETGGMAAMGFTVGRVTAIVLEGVGMNLTENLAVVCNMTIVGVITIAIFSAYQYFKLRCGEMYADEALSVICRQTMFSLSLLTVSIIAQGAFGGVAGLIVSTSIGLVFLGYTTVSSVHQRKLGERLREFAIEQYKPNFA